MTTTTKLEALMFQKGYIMWGVYFSTNQFVFLYARFKIFFMFYEYI
jgi:hypothetical protein